MKSSGTVNKDAQIHITLKTFNRQMFVGLKKAELCRAEDEDNIVFVVSESCDSEQN